MELPLVGPVWAGADTVSGQGTQPVDAQRGARTSTWPPARTSTWPHARTFSWPRTPVNDRRRRTDARPYIEQARGIAFETTDLGLQVETVSLLAIQQVEEGDYRAARTTADQAVQLARPTGNHYLLWGALNVRAGAATLDGDAKTATVDLDEMLNLCRSARDTYGTAPSLAHLGVQQTYAGPPSDAQRSLSEAVALFESIQSRSSIQWALLCLGIAENESGDASAALKHHARALIEAKRLGLGFLCGEVVWSIAAASTTIGHHRTAASLYACTEVHWDDVGRSSPYLAARRQRDIGELRSLLGQLEFEDAQRYGRSLDASEALGLAETTALFSSIEAG